MSRARAAADAADESLAGEVAAVVFTNPATGYGVVELTPAEGGFGEGPRAAGPLASLTPGQPVRLRGRWTEHPKHGTTFSAVAYELDQPRTTAGLAAFLASDRFPGVGETIAERIVDAFGLDLATVITDEPERLEEVRGVSARIARGVVDGWAEAGALAELVQRLADVGVPASVAAAVHRRFGERAPAVLDMDPYALLEVRGVRWAHADELARRAGFERLDERRLAAAAAQALRDLAAGAGHQCVPTEPLITEVERLLACSQREAQRALVVGERRGTVAVEELPAGGSGLGEVGSEERPGGAGDVERLWYTRPGRAVERRLAADLLRLAGAKSRVRPVAGEPDLDAELTAEQAEAVRRALAHPISVLTGGPGTGKTRTVVELVRACDDADLRVALCAPTGRAAKRMEELTGRSATTVHRLLEARGVPGEGFVFGYGADRRLPHDVVVADEWSMADTALAAALVAAVDDGAHLVLVGDADQLPSVGPGAVLRDLLAVAQDEGASDTGDDGGGPPVVATRLTHIHRQAAESRIVTLAHEVNAGAVPTPRGRMTDVFAVPERSPAVADRVAEIVAVRAPAYFGCTPADVQVLAPMYRGPAGVDRLNERLKERLNPAAGRPPVGGFHEGDRVVQTRNDAELEVANGDIGEVIATDARERVLEVAFPFGTVRYDLEQAADLAPAWCLTVHKSQGGEWPVVVLVLDPGHRVMLWRELVYTAITRAAHGLLLVGSPELLVQAAARTGSGARRRRTGLQQRLRAPDLGQEMLTPRAVRPTGARSNTRAEHAEEVPSP